MVCLAMRVRRRKWSFMDSCTSAGMSGDVWLIFTAASRKLSGSFSLSEAMLCVCMSACVCEGNVLSKCLWVEGPARVRGVALEERSFLRQGTQQSFQEAKVMTPSRERPHVTNTNSRRLKEMSEERERQFKEREMIEVANAT